MLRELADQLPRLEAEAALRDVSIVAIASGSVKKSTSDRLMATWHRLAGGRRQKVAKVVTAAELERAMVDLNIELVKDKVS